MLLLLLLLLDVHSLSHCYCCCLVAVAVAVAAAEEVEVVVVEHDKLYARCEDEEENPESVRMWLCVLRCGGTLEVELCPARCYVQPYMGGC